MSDNDTTILVAQAEGGDALQQGVIVSDAGSPSRPLRRTQRSCTPKRLTSRRSRRSTRPHSPASSSGSRSTFIVLYVVMSRAALPRIGTIIDTRRARIEGDLREAERLRGETDKAVAAYETALAEARKNAQQIAEETRDSIKADIDGKRQGGRSRPELGG